MKKKNKKSKKKIIKRAGDGGSLSALPSPGTPMSYHFSDSVNQAELPSIYQAVWSAHFC